MKTVKFYNNLNGKKTNLISTYENIQNDSDLACVMFKEIGMPNMPGSIDFEDLFNNNVGFESDYVIMEFVEVTKNYIIEIGNFKGEQGYKFSSTKTDRSEIISEFVNSQVILGTSKFLKSVFLGEDALMNTTHPVTIINLNK